jgi:hypothetical protein
VTQASTPADARRYIELQLARAEIELDHIEDDLSP